MNVPSENKLHGGWSLWLSAMKAAEKIAIEGCTGEREKERNRDSERGRQEREKDGRMKVKCILGGTPDLFYECLEFGGQRWKVT